MSEDEKQNADLDGPAGTAEAEESGPLDLAIYSGGRLVGAFHVTHDGATRGELFTPGRPGGKMPPKPAIVGLLIGEGSEDPDPVEQAHAFRALLDGGLSYAEIAVRHGVSNTVVAERLRLLSLVAPVRALVASARIPQRLARHIARAECRDQIDLAVWCLGGGARNCLSDVAGGTYVRPVADVRARLEALQEQRSKGGEDPSLFDKALGLSLTAPVGEPPEGVAVPLADELQGQDWTRRTNAQDAEYAEELAPAIGGWLIRRTDEIVSRGSGGDLFRWIQGLEHLATAAGLPADEWPVRIGSMAGVAEYMGKAAGQDGQADTRKSTRCKGQASSGDGQAPQDDHKGKA